MNTPLAYNYVATALMLAQINFIGPKLGLPVHFPLSDEDLVRDIVLSPSIINSKNPGAPNFGGRLDCDRYSFCFADDGRLCFVSRLHPWGHMQIPERNAALAEQRSIIDNQKAYEIATNWLITMSVNVKELEKTSPVTVGQQFQWSYTNGDTKMMLPIFDINWGDPKRPKVDVEIDGRTKALVWIRLEDDSVSSLPCISIKNLSELYQIGDDEFLKYTKEQKQALMTRFAGIVER